jgi:hypothetical protein
MTSQQPVFELKVQFHNVAGNPCPGSVDSPQGYAEAPVDGDYAIFCETGGMSNHGADNGAFEFAGTGKGCAICLPENHEVMPTFRHPAEYKGYQTTIGGKKIDGWLGCRSTDFHGVRVAVINQTGHGPKQFYKNYVIIVMHLPHGNNKSVIPFELQKRYLILKSIFGQAHRIKTSTNYPVFVVGDMNMTRAELGVFKVQEEGKLTTGGKMLIPRGGESMIGAFMSIAPFTPPTHPSEDKDSEEDVDLITCVDPKTSESWELDYCFASLPKLSTIEKLSCGRKGGLISGERLIFRIDRSPIGTIPGNGRVVHDHAILTVTARI